HPATGSGVPATPPGRVRAPVAVAHDGTVSRQTLHPPRRRPPSTASPPSSLFGTGVPCTKQFVTGAPRASTNRNKPPHQGPFATRPRRRRFLHSLDRRHVLHRSTGSVPAGPGSGHPEPVPPSDRRRRHLPATVDVGCEQIATHAELVAAGLPISSVV